MRLRSKPWAEPTLAQNDSHIIEPCLLKGKWKSRFYNGGDIHLEIGCGKGGFIAQMALQNPDINFIGLERSRKILAMAVKHAELNGQPPNLLFINGDASDLYSFFEENELKRIYINFCDPWRNKSKWFKRRLTHRIFLDKYANIMDSGSVFFKTDNPELFDFSLREFTYAGWLLKNVTHDLHNSGFTQNVMTEYEKRFSERGMAIFRLEAWK